MNTDRVEIVKALSNIYIELNKLHTEPGSKCHMLAQSIQFIQKLLKEVIK